MKYIKTPNGEFYPLSECKLILAAKLNIKKN